MNARRMIGLATGLVLAMVASAAGPLPAAAATTGNALVSVVIDGYADAHSSWPTVSNDGRFVAFQSGAGNLLPEDTTHAHGIFIRDTVVGVTEGVTARSDNLQFVDPSWAPDISADGQVVAFLNGSPVPGEMPAPDYHGNVFVFDRRTRQLALVTVAVTPERLGFQCAVSTDQCWTDYALDPDGFRPRISRDGRRVVFASRSRDLVPGDTNGWSDVFVYDRDAGTTNRISVAADGAQADGASSAPDISADGRYVVFESAANNLVPGHAPHRPGYSPDIYLKDLHTGSVSLLSVSTGGDPVAPGGSSWTPSISGDGRVVAFMTVGDGLVPADTFQARQVYTRDLVTGTTELISVDAAGEAVAGDSYNPDVNRDGTVVAFRTGASVVPDHPECIGCFKVAVRNRVTGVTVRADMSPAGEAGLGNVEGRPSISDDGRYVAYSTDASNLGAPDGDPSIWDVFLSDLGWTVQSAVVPAGSPYGTATQTGPSANDPVQTTVTAPVGGTVAISEQPAQPAQAGYRMLGWQVTVEAPAATAENPLSLSFTLHAGLVDGFDPASVTPFRDGVPVQRCPVSDGTATPDPCVAAAAADGDGDVTVTVLSSHASEWTFGAAGFAFSGFFPPVERYTTNGATAGSAVPVRFSLGGYRGLDVFAPGSPRVAAVSCSGGQVDAIEETEPGYSATLRYSAGSDQYTYVWKTSRSWAGTCRRLVLNFVDGSVRTAEFTFHK